MYKLRELQKEDITIINMWRSKRELIEKLEAPYRYINLETEYKWYENYLNNRGNTIRCAIVEEKNEDNILGLVSLINVNTINRSATFHIMIGEQHNRRKGLGLFAANEILKHGFSDMNLNRIELTVLETNIPAIKLYEIVGFKKEGIKRKSIYKEGKYVNTIMMAVLKDEYKTIIERN